MEDMRDKRMYFRQCVQLSAQMQALGEWHEVRTENLSEGGICILSPLPLPAGEEITLCISVLTDRNLGGMTIKGEVMWTDADTMEGPFLVGVKFDRMSAPEQARLRRCMALIATLCETLNE